MAALNAFTSNAAFTNNNNTYANSTAASTKFLTQGALTRENGFLTREDRVKVFGVDCADDITWRVWNVGGEYERRFLIKNTHDKRQIISYKLPKQKATFFVEFPEPATISSGMSYTLVVRFRPLELVEHHDELEVTVKGRGSFKIRLDAYTPYAHLTTPSKFDFNMSPVNVSSQHTFQIKNTGTVPLQFNWEIPAPFSIEPARGSLVEGESMDVTVAFTPLAACACVGQAICRLNETGDMIAVMNFSGIGKFAFIRVKDLPDGIVDFGDVLTSSSEVKYLSLVNPSFVDTDFDLRLTNPDITSAFNISPMSGTVPRGGETRLTIKFNPKNSGAHYNSDFSVDSVSCATAAKFRCSGSAVAPKVRLSTTNVDFGDVDIESFYKDPTNPSAGGGTAVLVGTRGKSGVATIGGKPAPVTTVEKWITVNNDSDLPIRFHFAGCDPGCAFKVTPAAGSLKPKSSGNVKITFIPTSPINHLRRLFVMTTAGENALILDVFGSAYTSKVRPAPFNNKAVQLFFSKLEYGLGGMTPEEGERLIASMNSGEEVSDMQAGAQEAFRLALEEINYPKRRRAGFATVFPKSVGQHTFPFSIDRGQMTVRHENIGQAQSVVVRNTTASKATAFWSIPEGEGQFWTVEPQMQDVPALGTATFRITCAPNAPPQTFGSYLECYVNYKTMRSFRLVNEDVFTPPHCLLVQCTHLAPYRENGPVPAVKFNPSVSFQPCREQRSVYQVLELTNDGDTAIGYDMQVETSMVPDAANAEYFTPPGGAAVDENGDPIAPDPEEDALANKRRALLEDVFEVYPSAGTLPAKSSTMVLMKFSPPLASKFYGALHVSYNGAPTVSGNVLLKGEGFVPRVELDCNSLLAFRPTTVGGTTTRQYTITNLSRIPLAFRASIPSDFADIVALSPSGGILKGSEKLRITATFTPNAARHYEFSFPVEVSVPNELDSPLSTTAIATIRGTVAAAAITAGPGGKKNSTSNDTKLPLLAAEASTNNGGALLSHTAYTPAVLPPDATTTQMCLCKAEGHAAFLSLEPLSTNLGDIGVGGPTSFPLTLYNTGLSDVCFEMHYKLRSCEMDASGAMVTTDSPLMSLTNGNGAAADGGALVLAGGASSTVTNPITAADNGSLVSFGPAPTGVIRARSHHTVSVSTKLAQRGKHSIVVYVISGGDLSILRSQFAAAAAMSGCGEEGGAQISDEFLARVPQCVVTANGQNASLQISDARCVYQQKSQLWRQMHISRINECLAEEAGRKDQQMRALSFDDTLAMLKPIKCNLGVDFFHAAPIRVHLALTNDSSTPVDFRFRFPIDNEIPKEPWHADQRGLDDPIANVVDRGLFDISPRVGTVPANDQLIITFTYFHSEVGEHQLPVILRVEEGKQVLLQLAATTIEADQKYLLFHHEMEHDLIPVAIGDLEPPIQYTEVQNLSSSSVNYTIDESSLTALKDANYDFPILQCLNPRGVIPPMSSLLVSWFFRPLEVKSYSATVNVSVEGGETYAVTISGKGYHPHHMTKREVKLVYESMFPMPRIPTLEHPSIPVRLSTDLLKFGPVPFHSYHRRHVSLTNHHPDDVFLFEWRSVLQHGDQIFEIEPPRGAIEPGVTVHFCISMYSGSFSHIIDTPVHCHVMNESLRLRRQERIAEREEQRRLEMDQKPETANTEFGVGANSTVRSNRSVADALTGRGLKPRHRHAITTVPPKYQSTVRLQKTIQRLEEMALAEEVDENADEWAHIEVTPTVIELLIQTRIMPLGHYTDVYGEDAANALFFPTMLGSMHPSRPGYLLKGGGGAGGHHVDPNGDGRSASSIGMRPDSVVSDSSLSAIMQRRAGGGENNHSAIFPALTNVSSFERDIAAGCIKEILRRVVQANDILDTLNDPSEDPVPYFCEMISTNSTGENKGVSSSAIAEFVVNEEDLPEGEFEGEDNEDTSNTYAGDDCVGDYDAALSRAENDRTPVPTDSGDIPRRKVSIAPSALNGLGNTPLPLNPSAMGGDASGLVSDEQRSVVSGHGAGAGSVSPPNAVNVTSQQSPQRAGTTSPTPFPRIKRSTMPVPGDVQCVAEEVIGDVIFFLMSQALTKEGVVMQACDVARKQRRASEARLTSHANSTSLGLAASADE